VYICQKRPPDHAIFKDLSIHKNNSQSTAFIIIPTPEISFLIHSNLSHFVMWLLQQNALQTETMCHIGTVSQPVQCSKLNFINTN